MNFFLFDLATGIFTGRMNSGSEVLRAANCPEGFAWLDGVSDWQSQRVDLDVLSQIYEIQDHISRAASDEWKSAAPSMLDDLRGKLLVDYIPPSPGPDHEWNAMRKRWRLRPEVAERQARRTAALAEIVALEQSSLRPLREVRLAELAGDPVTDEARARLQQIDRRIAELRKEIT